MSDNQTSKSEKTYKFYKSFYDKHRVSILQYDSLRNNFQKMIDNILGEDYYNYEMDVYECDRQCCEDITQKLKKPSRVHRFLQQFKDY